MSRHTFSQCDGSVVAYGFDHVCGYFVQVYKPGEDEPMVDIDSLTCSNSELYEFMEGEGVPSADLQCVAWDVPIP